MRQGRGPFQFVDDEIFVVNRRSGSQWERLIVSGQWQRGPTASRFLWGEMLLEPPPSAVESHGEDILACPKPPQEEGTEPVFLVEDAEGEKSGK